MLEQILTRHNITRALRAGPAADYIDRYVVWLVARRYTRGTMSLYLHALARYCVWLAQHTTTVGENALAVLHAYRRDLDARGLLYRRDEGRQPKLRGDVSAARLFTDFLIEIGIAKAKPQKRKIEAQYPLLGEYAVWVMQHRGLRTSSVHVYLVVLARLAAAMGSDPSQYTAKGIRQFVLEESSKFGVERAVTITIATRSFVRFLVATGRAHAGMEEAIPYPASWGLSSLPRYIEADDVERAIAVFDPATSAGIRDRAIILLLARLGLRAGEVAALRFEDIDWHNGRISVAGKGRRGHWLPLPQEVGDAILAYVQTARPKVGDACVFLRRIAPYRRLGMEGIAHVAKSALRRSGVISPTCGSHVFRHSVATTMLRQGVSLDGVGAILRHQHPDTTAHYAKVDHGALAEVAQPWPGVSSC